MDPRRTEPSDIERELQSRFNPENSQRFSSTAQDAASAEYVEQLVLPEDSRGRMPFTRDAFVISENPARVEWEREVRKFLSKLNADFGHRVTAPMIYEWTTGINIRELAEAEGVDPENWHGGGWNGSANTHLRHINYILKEYFGKSYKTTILGRPVGKAYTVRPSFSVRRKKPVCLTLWPEWDEGTLNP